MFSVARNTPPGTAALKQHLRFKRFTLQLVTAVILLVWGMIPVIDARRWQNELS